MNIHIGRWTLEVYERAIQIIREPDPRCPKCEGHGGLLIVDLAAPEWETTTCDCWDPAPVVRIPLAPRRAERVPF